MLFIDFAGAQHAKPFLDDGRVACGDACCSGNVWTNGYMVGARHNEGFNLAYADGHVKWAKHENVWTGIQNRILIFGW